ncbi:hypothetical protein [Halorubrum laminariae]|uniref:Envelope protein N-terminal domain-containing protein n=1 Tax=Halorubrum laminariae TaxID=1433523 RepID=A0ABD6BZF2_9EURY|nr:hypothetical protein [Halorubrum laminariae]
MKGLGASAVAAAGLSYEHGPVGNTQAVAPLVAGALAAGALGFGWSMRDSEIIGADAPPEGLTADVLKQQMYETARTRKSTNASTIVDNENILDGVEHIAYTEAKIAAIEELNAGSTESDVLSAAQNAIDAYFATVEENLLKSWNESVREVDGIVSNVENHPDLSLDTDPQKLDYVGSSRDFEGSPIYREMDLTLSDGSTFTLLQIDDATDMSDHYSRFDPTQKDDSLAQWGANYVAVVGPSESVTYMKFSDWNSIYSTLQSNYALVSDSISTWVTSVYGDVQSGEIEVSELVTPRERASMMAEEEGTSRAIADLVALNQPVDLEREATITVDSTGATMTGSFGLSDSSDGPLEAGTTYNPANFAGDVYFTTDLSLVEGDWSAIETAVDGGTITITSEPYETTAIEVTTTAEETVSVPAADWTDNGDGTWSHDASGDLETPITEVDSARFHATATETQYETLGLESSFTVDELVNTETGESADSTSFTSSEPQDDSNYITQEEWDDLEQQNQELIEKYENSQNNGGGGLDLSGLDMFGLPGEIVALVVAGAAALFASSN